MVLHVYSVKALWSITERPNFKKRYEHKMHYKLKSMLKDKDILNDNKLTKYI